MLMATTGKVPIQVLVAHALPVVRAGLAATLAHEPDLVVQQRSEAEVMGLATVPDGPAPHCAVPHGRVLPGTAPHVVVLDYVAGLRWAAARPQRPAPASAGLPRAEVMVLTAQTGEWDIRQAVHQGVLGFHLLDTPVERLATAVRLLAAGRRSFDDSVAARLADGLAQPALTLRERDVLALLAEGACNKEIARRLRIALGTVKAHMRTLLDKLQVESRVQAVVVARERGIVGRAGAGSFGVAG